MKETPQIGTVQHAIKRLGHWLAATSCAFGITLADAGAAAPDQTQVLELSVGGQRVLKIDKPIKRVAIGSSEIAEAKVLNDGVLLLQGNNTGETTLLLWTAGSTPSKSYRLQVNRPVGIPPASQASEGLQLKAAGELVILSGTSQDAAQHAIDREVAQRAAGGDDKSPVADATKMAFGGEVQIDVRVVEFSRKVLKNAGFSLLSNKTGFTFGTFAPSSLKPNGVGVANGNVNADFLTPISQALNLVAGHSSHNWVGVLSILEGNGFARTLAQPVLVAQSGQTADFLAGGEFPVPVPQALGQTTIQYKPFGIRLEVSPTVLNANRIALRVAPEVSELNFENAIAINGVTVPSLTTRRTATSVELGDGESFVIGGLVSQSILKNLNKIPGLGDLPVLGLFFKSVSMSREDKELLFIVTPHLVRPLAANAQLPALPGADKADYNPSLWNMLLLSDQDEVASQTGLSR